MSSLRLCRIVLADGVWRGRVVRRRNNVQAKETMAPGEPITRPGACAFRRSRPGTVGCMVSHPGCRCSFRCPSRNDRSEEHTSELQSLMRISYAVFCLKKQQILYNTRSDTLTT